MLRYHEATKHSPARVAGSRHRLDWVNQPLPFKVYRDLEPMPLPLSIEPSRKPALRSLRELLAVQSGAERIPSLEDVARLCILSNGITRVRRLAGGGEIAFRAAGTTGALYHVELYLVCRELPDLPAGVYHFGAHDNALRRLRAGDHRARLVEATGGEPSVARAPALIVATSTFWRNAWKYEARAWRHAFWDTGTVIANLLALAGGSDLPPRVVVGFADNPVNELVGADGVSEAAVCLVALGTTPDGPPPAPPAAPLDLRTLPVSARDVRYPLIEEAQAASSLESGTAAAAWRSRFAALRDGAIDADAADRIRLPRLSDTRDEPIEAVIRRRGS
ncbi:MAG TPA: SagB/ThcOx family dehydrogenase, partial [Candidatus Limnocylindria bacterium]|nr:SagB/ThcOx family dehydrogenase [Candidatus Limnocylindria bacterium]